MEEQRRLLPISGIPPPIYSLFGILKECMDAVYKVLSNHGKGIQRETTTVLIAERTVNIPRHSCSKCRSDVAIKNGYENLAEDSSIALLLRLLSRG